jgi:hypothetical protein
LRQDLLAARHRIATPSFLAFGLDLPDKLGNLVLIFLG